MLTNFPVHAKAPAAAAVLGDSGLVHGYMRYSVGTRRLGETVRVFHLGKLYAATVVDRRFFDPAGSRLNG